MMEKTIIDRVKAKAITPPLLHLGVNLCLD